MLRGGLDDLKAVGRIESVNFVEADTVAVTGIVLAEQPA